MSATPTPVPQPTAATSPPAVAATPSRPASRPQPRPVPTVWTNHFDGWSLTTRRDVARPRVGQLVTFRVTVTPPASGSFSMTVQWGDNLASVNPSVSNCMYGTEVSKGRAFTIAFQHAWRVGRTYRLTLQPTIGCPSGHAPAYPTDALAVLTGPLLGNGPQRPWVRIDYGGNDPGDYRKGDTFTASAVDNDGFVSRLVFDWGDGSRPTTVDFLAHCRRPPDDGWVEHPNGVNDLGHHYAKDPSAYVITVTAFSSGCRGENSQQTAVHWRPTRVETGPYQSPDPRP